MRKIVLAAILLSGSFTLNAKSDADVPAPKISIHQASDAAEALLLRSEDNIEPELFLAQEYTVQSINFSKVKNEWIWVVRFMHPKAKDYTVTYHVGQDGNAKFAYATD
jgi:hypothetical protein